MFDRFEYVDTDWKLREACNYYNEKYFNNEIDLYWINISWNKRLTSVAGRVISRNGKPLSLELSYKILKLRFNEMFLDVLIHEMIHLIYVGQGHNHNFIRKMNELKAEHPELKNLNVGYKSKFKIYRYIYKCSECDVKLKRARRINLDKYVCGSCRKELVLLEDKGQFV